MSEGDGSESASDSEQNDPPSSLAADAEQYELMQRAYAAVGTNFSGKDDLIGAEYCACSFFRGTFSSQKKCLFLAPWKISGMINI